MSKSNRTLVSGIPELLLLQLLAQRPMYGYELARAVRVTSRDPPIGVEGGVPQSEWPKDPPPELLPDRVPRRLLDDEARHDVARVAVRPAGPGCEQGLVRHGDPDELVVTLASRRRAHV